MSVVIRLARAGTKKRPVYHVVVADSRFPRDGRFIERLGHFNPLLPKDNEARLKLDMDKVKSWLAKGGQPSDRVSRFPDAPGVAQRAARNNPEKAVPRKERKAQTEAPAQTAEGSGMFSASCFETHGFRRAPQHEELSPHPEERALARISKDEVH